MPILTKRKQMIFQIPLPKISIHYFVLLDADKKNSNSYYFNYIAVGIK